MVVDDHICICASLALIRFVQLVDYCSIIHIVHTNNFSQVY